MGHFWVVAVRTGAVDNVYLGLRHGLGYTGIYFRGALADLLELNFVGGLNVVALYDVLLIAVDGETARRESLKTHLVIAVGTTAAGSLVLGSVLGPLLALLDFGVGRSEIRSLVVGQLRGLLLSDKHGRGTLSTGVALGHSVVGMLMVATMVLILFVIVGARAAGCLVAGIFGTYSCVNLGEGTLQERSSLLHDGISLERRLESSP